MYMDTGASTHRGGWNEPAVLAGVVLGLVAQCVCLPGFFTLGAVIAGGVDLLVLARLVLARILKEKGKGWVFYAALPLLIVAVLLLAKRIWLPD